MIRIAFDVGGVLSKRPEVFVPLISALLKVQDDVEVFILSDMHPVEKIADMCSRNGIFVYPANIISADYESYGELCKTIACRERGIDLLIDDFPGYVAEGDHVRLLMMPDPKTPYYADDWKTDGSEGKFGRRKKVKPTPWLDPNNLGELPRGICCQSAVGKSCWVHDRHNYCMGCRLPVASTGEHLCNNCKIA